MCHFKTAKDHRSLEDGTSLMFLLPFLIVLDHAFYSGNCVSTHAGGEPSQDLRIIANPALGREFYLFYYEATPEFNHLVGAH